MYNHYRNIRVTSDLINLTAQDQTLYEESSGDIRVFRSTTIKLPKEPENRDRRIIHYMIDRRTYEHLLSTGRNLEDIAVVLSHRYGLNGTPIAKLAWGKNLDIPVRLLDKAHEIRFQHK